MPLDIFQLLEEVGEDNSSPKPPEGGIPKQKCPGWIRWPLRICVFLFVMLDLVAQKIARKLIKPPFKQEGTCLRRGKCCHYILVPAPKNKFGRLFIWWNREINGFYVRDPNPSVMEGKEVLVMGCRYLGQDGLCQNYRFRPAVCRKWPLIEYFGYPRVLKGCGYKAVPRTSKSVSKD